MRGLYVKPPRVWGGRQRRHLHKSKGRRRCSVPCHGPRAQTPILYVHYQEKERKYAVAFPVSMSKDGQKCRKYFTPAKFGDMDEALKEAEHYAHLEAPKRGATKELRHEPEIRINDTHIQPRIGGITLRLDQKLYVVSTYIPGHCGHQRVKITVAQWGSWSAAYAEAERRALQYEGPRNRR